MAQSSALAELITLPGDRRDYYRMPEQPWERALQVEIDGIANLRRIVEQGLAALPPENVVARERLEESIDFCDFATEQWRGAIERWHEYREAKRQKQQQREASQSTPA
jgi:hypothetical protein